MAKMAKRNCVICVICGKWEILRANNHLPTYPHSYNLPYGKIHVHSGHCLTMLNGHINGAFPIMFTGFDDIVEHDLLSQEITKTLSLEEEERVSQEISSYLWDGQVMGDQYGEALDEGAKMAEKFYVDNLPREKLFLIQADDLKYDESKTRLEERMKGE